MTAIERAWYQRVSWTWLLLPLAWLFALITMVRRWAFRHGWLTSYRASVPVLVVGNITVGGAGKTPLTILLCELAQQAGVQVGVISRGYGGHSDHYPLAVTAASQPAVVGDEPYLIHMRTGCPVVVDPIRARGVQQLEQLGCQLIIADDGLQHYRLQRDAELIVVDGQRRWGNGLLLPAGPLREPQRRLRGAQVRGVICNGDNARAGEIAMTLRPLAPCPVSSAESVSIDPESPGLAFAGIGHPQRFFTTLEQLGYVVAETREPGDHQTLSAAQLQQWAEQYPWLMMTEKDAVKYRNQAPANSFYIPVAAQVNAEAAAYLTDLITVLIRDFRHGV